MKHTIKKLCLAVAVLVAGGQVPGFAEHPIDLTDVPVEQPAQKAPVESDSPTSGVPLADNSPLYTTPYAQYANQNTGKTQSAQTTPQRTNASAPIGQKQRTANESVVFKDSYQPYITNNVQPKPQVENTSAAGQRRRAANESVVFKESYTPIVTKEGSSTQTQAPAQTRPASPNVRQHRGVSYVDTTVESADQNNSQSTARTQEKPQAAANTNEQHSGVPYRAESPRYVGAYEQKNNSSQPAAATTGTQQRGVPYRDNNPSYQGAYDKYANQGTAKAQNASAQPQAANAGKRPLGQRQRTDQDSVVFKESYTPIITKDGSGSQTKRQTASTNNNAGKNQYKGVPYQDNRPLYHTPYEQYANQGSNTGKKSSAKAQGTAANSGTDATRANTRSNGAVAYQGNDSIFIAPPNATKNSTQTRRANSSNSKAAGNGATRAKAGSAMRNERKTVQKEGEGARPFLSSGTSAAAGAATGATRSNTGSATRSNTGSATRSNAGSRTTAPSRVSAQANGGNQNQRQNGASGQQLKANEQARSRSGSQARQQSASAGGGSTRAGGNNAGGQQIAGAAPKAEAPVVKPQAELEGNIASSVDQQGVDFPVVQFGNKTLKIDAAAKRDFGYEYKYWDSEPDAEGIYHGESTFLGVQSVSSAKGGNYLDFVHKSLFMVPEDKNEKNPTDTFNLITEQDGNYLRIVWARPYKDNNQCDGVIVKKKHNRKLWVIYQHKLPHGTPCNVDEEMNRMRFVTFPNQQSFPKKEFARKEELKPSERN